MQISKDFQPMKANFGILPALESAAKIGKRERGKAYADRALEALQFVVSGDMGAVTAHD